MGACYNDRKRTAIIKAKNQNFINNNSTSENQKEKVENKNFNILNNNDIQNSNYPTQVTETSPLSKIIPSNLSSNSSRMLTTPNESSNLNFILEATIGEIEIPIYVEKNENIMIIIKPINTDNSHNIWSFLPNENPVSYLGYPNYQYNNYNIGILLLRISGSQKIYYLDKMINSFKADSKGSLLISANLDPNDYLLYEPKGVLSITINGGIHYDENELYSPYDINSIMSNKEDININYINKEKKILKYINIARNNLLKFINDYFTLEEINEYLKFLKKFNFKKNELQMCDKLNMAAQEHCKDLCINCSTGEIGTDGSNLLDRIKKYYGNKFFYGENIIYGVNNPLLIFKNIIINKYSKKKKNRENIFFLRYNKVGICLREHLAYKYCCVITFSE